MVLFDGKRKMSTSSVPSRMASPFPRKKKTMKLFYHLLSDMKHQRVAVIALAVGQAVNYSHTFDSNRFWSNKLLIFPNRLSRILRYFWCVWDWFMQNKYQDYCLLIAWIRKNVKNFMKHQKYMESQRMTFDSWKQTNLLTTHWFCCTVQPH